MNREAGFTRGALLVFCGEISVVFLAGVVGFAVFSVLDLSEPLTAFTDRRGTGWVDEVFGAMIFSSIAMSGLLGLRWGRGRFQSVRLFESERRFEKLFDGTADALVVHTPSGRILDVNEQAVSSLGYSKRELIGRSVYEFEVSFVPEENPQAWERIVAGERYFMEGVQRRRDGSTFPVEIYSTLAEFEGRRVILSSVRDVSDREEMLGKLRRTRETNDALFAVIPDAVCRLDTSGVYLDVVWGESRTALRPREEVVGWSIPEVLGEETGARFMEKLRRVFGGGGIQTITYPLMITTGEERIIESRIVRISDEEAMYFARDITNLSRAIERINESEARSRAIVEAVPDIIFRFDNKGKCLDLHAVDETGLLAPKEELLGHYIQNVVPKEILPKIQRALAAALETGEMQILEYEIPERETFRYREVRIVPSGLKEVICFVRDVGERKEFEARIKSLAYRDELTGLPNKLAFTEHLEQVLIDPERNPSAVLILDIRDFSKINSTLGRDAGDRLLKLLASEGQGYLKSIGRHGDMFARYGGNEFATVLEDADLAEVEGIIEKSTGGYRDFAFLLDGMEVYLKPKIGVVMIEPDMRAPGIMRRATVALREAQNDPDSIYCTYDDAMGERSLSELHLERDLRRAIEQGQIQVHYQPEIYLDSGRIYSLEALARWTHPKRGNISPAEFISIAEETGMILPLGEHVLSEACRQMSRWTSILPDLAPCTVSVNVSVIQLRQSGFVEMVERTLRDNDLEPGRLQLEITESSAVSDFESFVETFSELRALGVRIALDDFGTGYSSLACLRQFPLDALKLDRSFIRDVATDLPTAQIVSSIVNIAHALNLHVVGEGIETAEQLESLKLLNCDIGQGYHFSRPIPSEATFALLENQTHRHDRR